VAAATPGEQRDVVLARLRAFPGRLAEVALAVAAADESAGGPPEGEWSARENVAHLVAVERGIWQARLDGLATLQPDQEPAWAWTEPGPVDDPDAATLDGALLVFRAARTSTVARLDALDGAGWARTGMHAAYGRLDVTGLATIAANHDDEHIANMTKGRAGVG
jgi:hypothetical protein